MKRYFFLMLAAILICGTMTMLTSCTEKDNPVDNNVTPKVKTLKGMYTVVLDNETGSIGNNAYDLVYVTYDFNADGTGLWSELYYNDDSSEPITGNGGEVGGQFKYTVDNEGKVAFTFDRPDMALQRGTLICLDEELVAFHHAKNDAYYFGLLQDESSANYFRRMMSQINGGSDTFLFEYQPRYEYGLRVTGDQCTFIGNNSAPVENGTVTLTKQSVGYCLQMYGGIIILDNYTGTYNGPRPFIDGIDRDLTIILKGLSVINFKGSYDAIFTSGNIKLGGSGELKFVTDEEGYYNYCINGANYSRDHDALGELALNNTSIKREGKIDKANGTYTWTYTVGKFKPLAEVTKEDIGKPVAADGYVYPSLGELKAAGATLAGMLASVTEKGHGLIISIRDLGKSKSYEEAKSKAEAYSPAIAGCGPWHLPTDVEGAEMVRASAGLDQEPLKYNEYNLLGLETSVAQLGCKTTKLSENSVKLGAGDIVSFLIDKNGKRGYLNGEYVSRVDDPFYESVVYNTFKIRACAKF